MWGFGGGFRFRCVEGGVLGIRVVVFFKVRKVKVREFFFSLVCVVGVFGRV